MVQGSIEMIQVIIDAIVNSTKLKLTIVDVLTAVDVKGEYLLDYKLSIEQAKLGVSSVFITFLSAVANT